MSEKEPEIVTGDFNEDDIPFIENDGTCGIPGCPNDGFPYCSVHDAP